MTKYIIQLNFMKFLFNCFKKFSNISLFNNFINLLNCYWCFIFSTELDLRKKKVLVNSMLYIYIWYLSRMMFVKKANKNPCLRISLVKLFKVQNCLSWQIIPNHCHFKRLFCLLHKYLHTRCTISFWIACMLACLRF